MGGSVRRTGLHSRRLEAMSRSIGTNLPDALAELLDGEGLAAKEGVTLLLLTTTAEGWPHVAMLSVGELVALAPDRLRAALWPASTATRNLTSRPQATIAAVHEGAAYCLRCRARRGVDLDVSSSEAGLAFFELELEDILEDVVPYAKLTSGVTFTLADGPAGIARWDERIAALRAAQPS